jgi:hypothetical protein
MLHDWIFEQREVITQAIWAGIGITAILWVLAFWWTHRD